MGEETGGVIDRLKGAYKIYDDAINHIFSELGFDANAKGEVSKRTYEVLADKRVVISTAKLGYIGHERVILLHVDEKQVLGNEMEILALTGLLRYQLKINHSIEEVIKINSEISATIGKKDFTLKNTSGKSILILTIPEVFILIETIEKIWNE